MFVSYRNLKSKQLGHFRRMGISSILYYSYHRIEALSCVKIVSQSSEIDVVTTSTKVPLYFLCLLKSKLMIRWIFTLTHIRLTANEGGKPPSERSMCEKPLSWANFFSIKDNWCFYFLRTCGPDWLYLKEMHFLVLFNLQLIHTLVAMK